MNKSQRGAILLQNLVYRRPRPDSPSSQIGNTARPTPRGPASRIVLGNGADCGGANVSGGPDSWSQCPATEGDRTSLSQTTTCVDYRSSDMKYLNYVPVAGQPWFGWGAATMADSVQKRLIRSAICADFLWVGGIGQGPKETIHGGRTCLALDGQLVNFLPQCTPQFLLKCGAELRHGVFGFQFPTHPRLGTDRDQGVSRQSNSRGFHCYTNDPQRRLQQQQSPLGRLPYRVEHWAWTPRGNLQWSPPTASPKLRPD